MSINRQPDHGRTIGNGVVIAYAVLAAMVAGLAIYGVLDGMVALGVAAVAFAFVFAGDLLIQQRDMEHERDMASAGADESDVDVSKPEGGTGQNTPAPVSE